MNKQTILERFSEATRKEKEKITAAALDYMREQGHPVKRQALHYWRTKNEMPRSPIAGLYLKAYQHAINN